MMRKGNSTVGARCRLSDMNIPTRTTVSKTVNAHPTLTIPFSYSAVRYYNHERLFGDGTDKATNRLFKSTQSTAEFITLIIPMAGPLRRVSQNYHWTLKRAHNDLHNSITPDLKPAPTAKIATIISPWDVSVHLVGVRYDARCSTIE